MKAKLVKECLNENYRYDGDLKDGELNFIDIIGKEGGKYKLEYRGGTYNAILYDLDDANEAFIFVLNPERFTMNDWSDLSDFDFEELEDGRCPKVFKNEVSPYVPTIFCGTTTSNGTLITNTGERIIVTK